MERFKEACSAEFTLIPATPRPIPAEPAITGEASQSQVKTRKTAACGNCKDYVIVYKNLWFQGREYLLVNQLRRNGIFGNGSMLHTSSFIFSSNGPTGISSLESFPPAIKKLFPRLAGIIDCFEIFVEAPGNLKARAQVWSSYKRHTTMNFLISCNLLGAINFLPRAWGEDESVTSNLVNKSKLLTKLPNHPRDQILADRGFTMKDEFECIAGVELLTPAFIKARDHFSAQDVETSRSIIESTLSVW